MEATAQPDLQRRIWRLARLSAWGLMLVGHLPPLLATLSEGRFYSAAVLLISEIFFLLKIADVRWLRLPAGRRALLAAIVILLLLHAPVLARGAADANPGLPWDVVVLVGGTLLAAGVLAKLRNRLATVRPRTMRIRAHMRWVLFWNRMIQAWLPPRFLPLHSGLLDRSPPLTA